MPPVYLGRFEIIILYKFDQKKYMCCPKCKKENDKQLKLNKTFRQKINPYSEKYLCLHCFNLYMNLFKFKFLTLNWNLIKSLN